jgi:hypothetical protein
VEWVGAIAIVGCILCVAVVVTGAVYLLRQDAAETKASNEILARRKGEAPIPTTPGHGIWNVSHCGVRTRRRGHLWRLHNASERTFTVLSLRLFLAMDPGSRHFSGALPTNWHEPVTVGPGEQLMFWIRERWSNSIRTEVLYIQCEGVEEVYTCDLESWWQRYEDLPESS